MLKPVPTPQAKKIQAAQKRVATHRADKAPTLKLAYNKIEFIANIAANVHASADTVLQGEIDLLTMICRRFTTKVKNQQYERSSLLKKLLEEVVDLERILKEAKGPRGYGLKKLAAEAERDARLIRTLKASLTARQREAAFILAELEQTVNPVSGLKIAGAKQRAENEKRRKKAVERSLDWAAR